MMNLTTGTTVRGPISVSNGKELVTLVDKHMIVLQVQGGKAMCMYTGTDDGSFASRCGYVAFPTENNVAAGWKANGKFFCDAALLCCVPVELLTVEGRIPPKFLAKLTEKVMSPVVAKRREVTQYEPKVRQQVTGYVRQAKSGALH